MTTRPPGGGDHDVLSQGSPRNASGRAWGTAVACLLLGALGGVLVDDALDDRRAARDLASAPPTLSAGVIQEDPDPGDGRRFVVPVHNGGPAEVSVDSVVAPGWVVEEDGLRAVTIAPDSWAMLPLAVRIDCGVFDTTAPERLTVRSRTAAGSFEQDIEMPVASRVLTDEASRLCLDPQGGVPTALDIVGTWYVEEGGAQRGTMFRLRQDGTFAIDPDLFRFGPDIDVLGSFDRSGATLRLTAEGGHDCRPGDRTVWDLTLLEDGRLHIRHDPAGDRWCEVEDREVWIARPVPDAAGAP